MEEIIILVNADGTATAKIDGESRTFPDIKAAAVWADALLYGKEGEDSG